MSATAPPEMTLLKEAADWAVILQYGTPTESEREAFDRWRVQSPAHEAAWARAQEVFQTFSRVPTQIGKEALQNLERRYGRRQSLRLLGALLVAAPAGWLAVRYAPWREWAADVRTATGERRTVALPDGSRLVLNTESAVNIAFGATERRILLVAGEILITTHADTDLAPRPFLIDTQQGVVRALGTRFSVRRLESDALRVRVFQSAVEIRPLASTSRIVRAGEQVDFGATTVTPPVPVANTAALWEQGMLLAQDMRLEEVISELARYRTGILRCDPAVAALRVSGALSLTDTDAALAVLTKSLPLRIERRTRYWVMVGAAR